jgi:hypothetical protein
VLPGVRFGRFDTKDGSCWDEFVLERQDEQAYGPGAL